MRFTATIILTIVVFCPALCLADDNVDNKTSERLVRDYFPMEEGWAYMYRSKEGPATYTVIKAFQASGLKGYYFLNYDEKHKEMPIFIVNGLGVGFYYMRGEDLYTVPIVGTIDMDKISRSKAYLLLSNPLQDGHTTKLQRNKTTIVYRVSGPESVTVPAGAFDDCMKVTWLTILTNGDAPVERGVWLARGVGIVKIYNDMGYVGELVEYASPKK